MYELRRIQHGDRPVTGQTHRDNIANFIAKHIPQEGEAESQRHKFNVANVDPVEQHRPEAVLFEVSKVIHKSTHTLTPLYAHIHILKHTNTNILLFE